ncbi:class I SAM-dependent methyltransferase [Leptolyngbya sp. BC1307]|uniref:class I SAM-dependent methyltransferase n=1 Tax=Leptolyngbya sp. BC1307 TaxID=2029589 RepID=UPI000EFB86E5
MGQSISKSSQSPLGDVLQAKSVPWLPMISAVAQRFDAEYAGESFDLPEEVEAMPVFRDWAAGSLNSRIASPFWQIAQPKKNQHCLDLGCGFSFLIYEWKSWQALFHGQDVSETATKTLHQRGPQLDSKLFKGVKQGPAHQLDYPPASFDLVIATGFSCYYPLDYWQAVMEAVKPLLKPGGFFVFDVVDPEQALAENWAILETYLGAEVFLESLTDWRSLIKATGAKVVKQQEGELFHLYKVRW